MLSTLKNAWKVQDLRKKLLWTLFLVAIYRLGNCILVPGINTAKLQNMSSSGLLGFYDIVSGGAFSRCSIFSLGVMPYINSSIIIQLLTVAIPALEQLSKEGEDGRKKLNDITRYLAIAFSVLLAFTQYAIMNSFGAVSNNTKLSIFVIILTLIASAIFLMWLGDQLTEKGIGNGISLLVFLNIISRFPDNVKQLFSVSANDTQSQIMLVFIVIVVFAMLISVIIMSLAERRIAVQYAGKNVGSKTYKGQSTHIPINMNNSSVIAIIFAMSVSQFPYTLGKLFTKNKFLTLLSTGKYSPFNIDKPVYIVMSVFLIIFFTWFYTEITFKPEEMSENIHKSSGLIPGVRPGDDTTNYLTKVLFKCSILGGAFAAIIAAFPMLLQGNDKYKGLQFGGTTLLILVGVAVDSLRQLQSQLVMRHYKGFLK